MTRSAPSEATAQISGAASTCRNWSRRSFRDVVGRAFVQLDAVKFGATVETPKKERQGLAEMTERKTRARKPIKEPLNTSRKACDAVSTPHSTWRAATRLVRQAPASVRLIGWMQIDQRVHGFGALQNGKAPGRRDIDVVWPLIMAPQNLRSFRQRSSSSAALADFASADAQNQRNGWAVFGFALRIVIGLAGSFHRKIGVALDLHTGPDSDNTAHDIPTRSIAPDAARRNRTGDPRCAQE